MVVVFWLWRPTNHCCPCAVTSDLWPPYCRSLWSSLDRNCLNVPTFNYETSFRPNKVLHGAKTQKLMIADSKQSVRASVNRMTMTIHILFKLQKPSEAALESVCSLWFYPCLCSCWRPENEMLIKYVTDALKQQLTVTKHWSSWFTALKVIIHCDRCNTAGSFHSVAVVESN